MMRRTRIVCVSDTHGHSPVDGCFKLPPGDVLIHAGDLTKKGSLGELRKTMDWIVGTDFEVVIIVAGNHDVTLDPEFYAKHGSSFHGQSLEDPNECIRVVAGASPSIVYLRHQSALIRLTRPDGPETTFKVFGSPYSQFHGNWAFGYDSNDASTLWSRIPQDADIVVTHTPPYAHCDNHAEGNSVGCKALGQALCTIRPLLAVCGHVHESRGYERVRWDLPSSSSDMPKSQEGRTIRGELPPIRSKKLNLVDLTGRKDEYLSNDGFSICDSREPLPSQTLSSQSVLIFPTWTDGSSISIDNEAGEKSLPEYRLNLRRRETCIVNAAIMATSWPYHGGKMFNAPIIVDLNLPVWKEADHIGNHSGCWNRRCL